MGCQEILCQNFRLQDVTDLVEKLFGNDVGFNFKNAVEIGDTKWVSMFYDLIEQKTSQQTLANYMGIHVLLKSLPFLGKFGLEQHHILENESGDLEKNKHCLHALGYDEAGWKENFNFALQMLMTEKLVTEESFKTLETISPLIKEAVIGFTSQAGWLDNEAKNKAIAKIQKVEISPYEICRFTSVYLGGVSPMTVLYAIVLRLQ